MVNWKIYYSDLSTFSDLDGDWALAPLRGILAVVVRDPTGVWGRFVLHNHEFYYKVPGAEVMCSESREAIQAHVPDLLDSQIKLGGNADQATWNRVMLTAGDDPDFEALTPRRRTKDWPVDDPNRPNI